jgi:predicted transcriptional regulator
LSAQERALLAAELFALKTEADAEELDKSLARGLADVKEGRVRPIEDVKGMISQWTSKS